MATRDPLAAGGGQGETVYQCQQSRGGFRAPLGEIECINYEFHLVLGTGVLRPFLDKFDRVDLGHFYKWD